MAAQAHVPRHRPPDQAAASIRQMKREFAIFIRLANRQPIAVRFPKRAGYGPRLRFLAGPDGAKHFAFVVLTRTDNFECHIATLWLYHLVSTNPDMAKAVPLDMAEMGAAYAFG